MIGLKQDWSENTVFINFPYSKGKDWAKKIVDERFSCIDRNKRILMVVLCASRTDTKWYKSLVDISREIRFVEGRLKFGNQKNSAPFPSTIFIIDQQEHLHQKVRYIKNRVK